MSEQNLTISSYSSPKTTHPCKHLLQKRAGGPGAQTAGWAAKPPSEAMQAARGTTFSAAEHRAAGGCPGAWWPAPSPGKAELDNHDHKPQVQGNALLLQTWQPPGAEGPQFSVQSGKYVVAVIVLKEAFGVTGPHCPPSVELRYKGIVKPDCCWKLSRCFKVAYGTWLKITLI